MSHRQTLTRRRARYATSDTDIAYGVAAGASVPQATCQTCELSAYASAMRRPVLPSHMVLPESVECGSRLPGSLPGSLYHPLPLSAHAP
eukprot:2709618-Rhodomonas_salina.1